MKFRLTRWYFCMLIFSLFLMGGSFYGMIADTSDFANNGQTDALLSQDAGRLLKEYREQLSQNLPLQVTLPANEIALLLSPTGQVLARQGPLTDAAVRQLQGDAANLTLATLNLPLLNGTRTINSDYRVLSLPIVQGETNNGLLILGHAREYQLHVWPFWLWHGFIIILLAAIAGFLLAFKAMRPVQMITRTAQEINATDLRRRLNFRHRDEFGLLAATFDSMLDRLEAAFKRQTQFTADASHELRTPLTIIDLEINRALTQLQTPEEYRQVLEQIQVENEQMAAIVNSLLLLARADTGQIALRREMVDLSDIALACVERLLPLAQQKHVAIATGSLPELPVFGDLQHLSRMVLNLLENAIKYTSGVGQHVRVDLLRDQAWVLLRVRDDGPGIAREHLPNLFERFYRVDKARSRSSRTTTEANEPPGGTGLGLAIAQWIAQAHGGEIRVESEPGAGSLFEVRLPLRQAEEIKPLPAKGRQR